MHTHTHAHCPNHDVLDRLSPLPLFSPISRISNNRFTSVFNAGCKALLGTINVEQFERELMHQNPAGPPVDGQRHQEPDLQPEEPEDLEYVFVEVLGNPNGDENAPGNGEEDDDHYNSDDADEGGAGAGLVPAPAGAAAAARARARRVSGKRARRGFAERRERQEERRLALEAFGQHQWD